MAIEGLGALMTGAVVKGATTTVAKSFIDQVVVPYLQGMFTAKTEKHLKQRLGRYIRLLEAKTRTIPTFINTSGIVVLEDVYEPLSVHSPSLGLTVPVKGFPADLFSESRCLAIADDAGMGKSTIAKFVARRAISEHRPIPLLIELRRIRLGQSIISCLCQELAGGAEDSIEGKALIDLFSGGNFIFILDGFDEVEESLRREMVSEINEISVKFSFCYFLLTSRPEYAVSLFPEFLQLDILKLTVDQAYSLIRRYDGSRGLAKLLIPKIKDAGVEEFLGNPLLVTLLYRAFSHRNSVPSKRVIFYRQVYDALYEDHDLSKGDAFARKKESGLDSDDFHRLVRALAFETFRSARLSYSGTEMLELTSKAVTRSGLACDSKKVTNDLVKAVPLFLRDGLEIKWAHKSFQEYFASQYILLDTGSVREDLIKKMFDSREVIRYREIFRFVSEMDVGLMRNLCVLPLLEVLCLSDCTPEQFELNVICATADLYYIGGLQRKDRMRPISDLMREKLGVDIATRRTAITWGVGNLFALVGVLRERGERFLVLPTIDPEMFPKFTRASRAGFVSKWGDVYGDKVLHLNSSVGDFAGVRNSVGSMECIEAASNFYHVKYSSLQALRESAEQRSRAIDSCVLDEY